MTTQEGIKDHVGRKVRVVSDRYEVWTLVRTKEYHPSPQIFRSGPTIETSDDDLIVPQIRES